MSKRVQIWLMIAAVLLLLGMMAFAGAMTILGWNFATISTIRYQSQLHNVTEKFQNISIECDTANVIFQLSDNQQCQVGCYEQINASHTVTVNGDSLVIKIEDNRKWYEHIGILIDRPIVALYLPESKYGTLTVKSSTGDVTIPEDFSFQSIDIAEDTGDIKSLAAATDAVKLKTSTGDIFLKGITTKSLDLTASTGDINLQNVIAEGKFSIETSTGNVKFKKCDAAEIFVTTDTGNVTGSLQSEKVFFAQSDTGKIEVPKTIHGGRCEITTDTGNIKINIEP